MNKTLRTDAEKAIHAAINATSEATLNAGGNIGDAAKGSYVGVQSDTVVAKAGKSLAIAGANDTPITLGVDKMGGPAIEAGGDVALYTSDTINVNDQTVKSGNGITITAKNYKGGIVGIDVGNTLTVNNINLWAFQDRR